MPPEGTPQDVGMLLAKELVENLAVMNKNMETNRELLIEIRDLIAEQVETNKVLTVACDELAGRIQVFTIAADIVSDIANGSKNVTVADLCHAIVAADKETFPDDDEDDDDDGGEPVGGGGGKRRIS
jgi:hypothetical protein